MKVAPRNKIMIRRTGTSQSGYPWVITCVPCWNESATRFQWRRRTHAEARLRALHHARNRHGVIL